jgi:hypothetical protein
MFLLRTKPLFVVLLFLTVTTADASLTVTADSTIAPTIQRVADSQIKTPVGNEAIKPIDSKLADIGRELRTPPISSAPITASTASQLPYVKSLPAVPRALLMALTGFLWVSLIKDRKVWLAALTGILCVGQAGIQALPQLALSLSHRNHIEQQSPEELIHTYCLANSSRLRSDIEGIRYIGLLHHLAGIPNDNLTRYSRLLQTSRISKSQLALLSVQYNLNPLFECWAYHAQQHTRFSPAFIFQNLPRGPPEQA